MSKISPEGCRVHAMQIPKQNDELIATCFRRADLEKSGAYTDFQPSLLAIEISLPMQCQACDAGA